MQYDHHRINSPSLISKYKWIIQPLPATGPSLVLLEKAERGTEVARELPFISYPIINKSDVHDLVEKSFNVLIKDDNTTTTHTWGGKPNYPISSEMQSVFLNKKLVQEIASSFIAYAFFTTEDQREAIPIDFYCPSEDLFQTMPVLKWISKAAINVCQNHNAFQQIKPTDLRNFCAVMYSNAFSTSDDTTWDLQNIQNKCTKNQGVTDHIQDENIHPDITASSGRLEEIQSLGRAVRLYKWMSKVAHSCEPNLVVITTDAQLGELKVFSRRQIAPEEPLTYSYLTEEFAYGGLIFGSRLSRQRQLWYLKFFVCECHRCQNDNSRIFYCPDCELPELKERRNGGWECTACGVKHEDDQRIKLIVSGREEELELISYRIDQMMQEKATDPRMFLWMRDIEKHVLTLLDDKTGHPEDRLARENGLYGYVMCMLALHHLTVVSNSPFKPFMMMNFTRGITEALAVVEYLEKKMHEFPGFSISISLALSKMLIAISESLDLVALTANEREQLNKIFNFARVCVRDMGEFMTSNSSCLQRIYSLCSTYERESQENH